MCWQVALLVSIKIFTLRNNVSSFGFIDQLLQSLWLLRRNTLIKIPLSVQRNQFCLGDHLFVPCLAFFDLLRSLIWPKLYRKVSLSSYAVVRLDQLNTLILRGVLEWMEAGLDGFIFVSKVWPFLAYSMAAVGVVPVVCARLWIGKLAESIDVAADVAQAALDDEVLCIHCFVPGMCVDVKELN